MTAGVRSLRGARRRRRHHGACLRYLLHRRCVRRPPLPVNPGRQHRLPDLQDRASRLRLAFQAERRRLDYALTFLFARKEVLAFALRARGRGQLPRPSFMASCMRLPPRRSCGVALTTESGQPEARVCRGRHAWAPRAVPTSISKTGPLSRARIRWVVLEPLDRHLARDSCESVGRSSLWSGQALGSRAHWTPIVSARSAAAAVSRVVT
jgi:hypothetical protein